MKILIKSTHGMGDVVQLTVVLQHLAKHHPDWEIDVWAKRGKESACRGLAHKVWHDQEPEPNHREYNRVFNLGWYECYSIYGDSPCSKAAQCLREIFRIHPERDLLRYRIDQTEESRERARTWLESIGCERQADGLFNAVLIHYEGNTSGHKKNLDHGTAGYLCEIIRAAGFVPVILDWDKRSPLPNGKTIHCPAVGPDDLWGGFGSGDAERLAALISQSCLLIGVDSGPQKVAGATRTPTIAVWTGHHPCQFYDLCPNVVHLVPDNLRDVPPGQHSCVQTYFEQNYRHEVYQRDRLAAAIGDLALRTLNTMGGQVPKLYGFSIHEDRPEQDWVIIEDVYLHDCYRTVLIPKKDEVEYVLDIGAHIGTFARLWHERNPKAKIVCVEACPENIPQLVENVGEFAEVLQAACTYETGEITFLNSVLPTTSSRSTGGSAIITDQRDADPQYVVDTRPMRRVTLHQLLDRLAWPQIDLLKLDCEGSEFSILEHAPLKSIRFIVGEYHSWSRFQELLAKRFSRGWSFGHMSQKGDMGNFHLRNDSTP